MVKEIKSTSVESLDCKLLQPQKEFDHIFKIIFVGNSAVGKSAIINRITKNEFFQEHEVTIGVEIGTSMVKVGGSVLKL